MNLPYPKQKEAIDLTKSKLAKMRLYIAPPHPSNGNQDKLGYDKEDGSACVRLANQVGVNWKARQASLLEVANGEF